MGDQQKVGLKNMWKLYAVVVFTLLIASCGKAPEDEVVNDEVDFTTAVIIVDNLVSKAEWDSGKERLTVQGDARRGDSTVKIYDGVNQNDLIGSAYVANNRQWRFRKTYPSGSNVPCSIKAVTRLVTQVVNVKNAPRSCSALTTNLSSSSSFNSAPNSFIVSPTSSVSVFVGDSVAFRGSANDPDGDLNLTYRWNFSGGAPGETVLNPGSVQFNTAGTYRVSFVAIDSAGLADPTPATVFITVNDVSVANNVAPDGSIVSPATNSSFVKGSTVSFVASATDANGDSNLRYVWDFGGYAPRQTGQRVSLVLNQVGVLNVKLLVRDSTRLWDQTPATMFLTVTDQVVESNQAPNGIINSPSGSQTISAGQSVYFSASGTDPDGDAINYQWGFGDSGVQQSLLRIPGNVQFNIPGTYVVSLLATDVKGEVDPSPATVTITVNSVNSAPNGSIVSPLSASIINAGDSLFFKGNGTDPENDSLNYRWSFGGASPDSNQQNPGSVRFDTPGEYLVSLVVSDTSGLADPTPATLQVTVRSIVSSNQAPQSIILTPTNNLTVQRGQTVNFSGRGSDADNDTPLSFRWNFSGGATNSVAQNPGDVQFNQAGFYAISLTVTDSRGLADPTPAVRYVQVVENVGNQAPVASIVNPANDMTINVGDTILFAGSAVDPENNMPLNYFWNFDGGALNSHAQSPGKIRFDMAGVYVVKLSVTDSLGASDTTPAVRVITVNGSNNISLPDSDIIQPAGDVVINVGDSLNFQGRGIDPNGNTPFTHLWNFAGVAPNSTNVSPGSVRFDNAGVFEISYRVTNSLGLSDPTPAKIQVTVQNVLSVNEPPNSRILTPAMAMTIYEGDSLSFSGIGYDPEGDALNYLWSFNGAAPDQYVQNPGVVTFNTSGVFNVMMAASDSGGLTDPTPAILPVTVLPVANDAAAPNALIVSPGSDISIFEGDSVNFVGLGLDSDGDIITNYYWNFDGASPNSVEQSPGSIKFPNAGSYRVRFNVTDADGLSDPTPDEVVIMVQSVNMPTGNTAPNGIISSPVSDVVIKVGEAVNFTATGTDADSNQLLSYRWNFDGATPNTTVQNPGWVSFNRVGTYRVILTVTDSDGQSDLTPAERFITVQSYQTVNQSPNGAITNPVGEQFIAVGDSVYFSGNGSDPEANYPLTYYWSFDGAAPISVGSSPGVITFSQAGIYDVELRVIDSLGAMDDTPATVRINVGNNTPTVNLPPQSVINEPANNRVISVGDSLAFSGDGIDPEGESVSYHWGFGTSGVADRNEQSPIVTFNRPGVFTVSLTTTDTHGLSDPTPAQITVTVEGIATLSNEPDGVIIKPAVGPLHINRGDSVTFEAQATDPNGDTNLFVLWNFGTYPITNKVGSSVRVTFEETGLAVVTLKVKDSTNLWDPTPATMEVYVH